MTNAYIPVWSKTNRWSICIGIIYKILNAVRGEGGGGSPGIGENPPGPPWARNITIEHTQRDRVPKKNTYKRTRVSTQTKLIAKYGIVYSIPYFEFAYSLHAKDTGDTFLTNCHHLITIRFWPRQDSEYFNCYKTQDNPRWPKPVFSRRDQCSTQKNCVRREASICYVIGPQ